MTSPSRAEAEAKFQASLANLPKSELRKRLIAAERGRAQGDPSTSTVQPTATVAQRQLASQANATATMRAAVDSANARSAATRAAVARSTQAANMKRVADINPPMAGSSFVKRALGVLAAPVAPILTIGLFRSASKGDRRTEAAEEPRARAVASNSIAVAEEQQASNAAVSAQVAAAQGVSYDTQVRVINAQLAAQQSLAQTQTQVDHSIALPTPGTR